MSAFDLFCLDGVEDFVGDSPDVGRPLHQKVLSLPYHFQWFLLRSCRFGHLAAQVLMVSDLCMACLCFIEKWFGNSVSCLSN
jgi:hypothetical protein